MRTLRVVGALALAGAVLAGCGGVQSRVHGGTVDQVLDQNQVRRRYFEAVGIGASDPLLATETQRKALAREAAVIRAQYELLALIRGVNLKAGISVEQAMSADSRIQASILEALRGAEIVKSEFTNDHGCVVTLRLPRAKLHEAYTRAVER